MDSDKINLEWEKKCLFITNGCYLERERERERGGDTN